MTPDDDLIAILREWLAAEDDEADIAEPEPE